MGARARHRPAIRTRPGAQILPNMSPVNPSARRLPRPPTSTSPCSPTTAAGTLHTKLEPLPGGDLIGAQLARQRPGLCSIDCV
jgi:hypothetical protein